MTAERKLKPDTADTYNQAPVTPLQSIAAKNRAFEKQQADQEREAIAQRTADIIEERKLARRQELKRLQAAVEADNLSDGDSVKASLEEILNDLDKPIEEPEPIVE